MRGIEDGDSKSTVRVINGREMQREDVIGALGKNYKLNTWFEYYCGGNVEI